MRIERSSDLLDHSWNGEGGIRTQSLRLGVRRDDTCRCPKVSFAQLFAHTLLSAHSTSLKVEVSSYRAQADIFHAKIELLTFVRL